MDFIIDALTKLLSLLKEAQDMAGGRKRELLVFWVVFIILVLIGLKPAYESASWVFSQISITTPIINAIVSLLFVITGFVVLLAVVTLAGALLGTIIP